MIATLSHAYHHHHHHGKESTRCDKAKTTVPRAHTLPSEMTVVPTAASRQSLTATTEYCEIYDNDFAMDNRSRRATIPYYGP
jgi:hypothetical protein